METGEVLLILEKAPCYPPVKIFRAIDDDISVMYLTPSINALVENNEESATDFAERLNMKDASNMLAEAWDSLERFQECNEEDVETWMACVAEGCGFNMLNDDDIASYMEE
ncbi:hypothetical protein TNCV_5068811 [Trichonephila clavipes]|nr:hypothetical protein TNCV_5068811 [Trichonephila clavipes]